MTNQMFAVLVELGKERLVDKCFFTKPYTEDPQSFEEYKDACYRVVEQPRSVSRDELEEVCEDILTARYETYLKEKNNA